MELKDFIVKTIVDINEAIEESSKKIRKNVGIYSTGKDNQRHIEFDVAVVAEKKNKKGGKGGIRVWLIEAGGSMSSESSNSSISRIKFGVRLSKMIS